MEIIFVILSFIGIVAPLYYLAKTYVSYVETLMSLKDKEYDPMDHLEDTRLGVYLARRRYSRALREKQRLENTNRDKLNY